MEYVYKFQDEVWYSAGKYICIAVSVVLFARNNQSDVLDFFSCITHNSFTCQECFSKYPKCINVHLYMFVLEDRIVRNDNTGKEKRVIDFMHTRKFMLLFSVIMCLIFLLGWVVLVKNENRIIEIPSETVAIVDDSAYIYNLETVQWKQDEISISKDYVIISGWLIKQGESVDKAAIRIVLRDTESGRYYVLPTDVIVRNDVTTYFADGNNYDYSGFSVKIPYWSELDTDTDYELFAQYDLNNNVRVYVPFHTSLKMDAEG